VAKVSCWAQSEAGTKRKERERSQSIQHSG